MKRIRVAELPSLRRQSRGHAVQVSEQVHAADPRADSLFDYVIRPRQQRRRMLLSASSYRVGCSTGRSPGLDPLIIFAGRPITPRPHRRAKFHGASNTSPAAIPARGLGTAPRKTSRAERLRRRDGLAPGFSGGDTAASSARSGRRSQRADHAEVKRRRISSRDADTSEGCVLAGSRYRLRNGRLDPAKATPGEAVGCSVGARFDQPESLGPA